jgi:hypothetical protein
MTRAITSANMSTPKSSNNCVIPVSPASDLAGMRERAREREEREWEREREWETVRERQRQGVSKKGREEQ